MKSQMFIFVIALCLAVTTATATEVGPGPVSGEWDALGNPYNINGQITVPAGECLTIDEGVEVIFQGHHKLIVYGCMEAVGTEASPILFTAANTLDGWHGIRFIDASDNSHLAHCIIEYGRGLGIDINDPDGWGGGLLCDNTSPVIKHCTFRDNSTNWIGGGIMCHASSSPTIEHCHISGNFAGNWGGGVAGLAAGHLIVRNCTISGNTAGEDGGGIAGEQITLTITDNDISGNKALNNNGGGICSYGGCTGSIKDNVILGNHAEVGGGGMIIWYWSSFDLTNNLVYKNTAGGYGAGICCFDHASATITNSTVCGNISNDLGGGLSCETNSSMTVVNSILWNNTADTSSDEILVGYTVNPSTVTISYSDVRGGQTHVDVWPGSTLNWGSGMIDEDPLFFDPNVGDYHLCQDPCQPGVVNPCVDAGDPVSSIIDWTTRTDCHADEADVDMGYHYPFPETVIADLNCVPDAGVLPFTSMFSVVLGNSLAHHRTVAGRIDVSLAGGANFANWRAGFSNLGPGETFTTSWQQVLPALDRLVGLNLFELHAEDVTPPPYNQPPYLPSGATVTAACSVTGLAP